MKIELKIIQKVAFALALFLLGALEVTAQETATKKDKKDIEIQHHTVMEQFAAEMMPTAEERRQKKIAHLAEIEKLKKALDTMDISRRKKRKILADLINKPYSDRVNQAMAEISFEDGDEIIKD